jgi:hypothetical protein
MENFDALPEAQQAELTDWFFEKKISSAAAVKRCRERWHATVTPETMNQWRSRAKGLRNQQRHLRRLETGAATARVFQKQITDHPAEVFALLFRVSSQAVFEQVLDGMSPENIRLAHDHLRLLLTWRKDDRDEKRHALAREKWEFDASEACLKQLPELKVISDEPQLSFKEKIRQIRLKLFGSAT